MIKIAQLAHQFKNANMSSFLWGASLIINIITFLVIYYHIKPGNSMTALRYNILTGVDMYGQGINFYLIPAVALLILAANFILYRMFKDSKNILTFLSAFVSLLAQIILLLSVLLLSKVN